MILGRQSREVLAYSFAVNGFLSGFRAVVHVDSHFAVRCAETDFDDQGLFGKPNRAFRLSKAFLVFV